MDAPHSKQVSVFLCQVDFKHCHSIVLLYFRWRFTFYLGIFIYAIRYLWVVSCPGCDKVTSRCCSISETFHGYNDVCCVWFPPVSLDVEYQRMLVQLPISGNNYLNSSSNARSRHSYSKKTLHYLRRLLLRGSEPQIHYFCMVLFLI